MAKYELKIERIIKATPDKIWAAITKPELLEEWFCPKPWFVKIISQDLRAGGAVQMNICGPNGEEFPNNGIYLCVEENKRLVTTDAFIDAWTPSEKAFMVGETILEDLGDGTTKYIAKAMHWNEADNEQHEKMGFYDGWNKAADQLEELLQNI